MSTSAIIYPADTNSGTVTSFIPLTTTWTPPSGCYTKYRLDGPSLMAFDPAYGLDVETGLVCAPPAMTTWWEQGLLGVGGGGDSYKTRISIGPISCPKDWPLLASSTKDSSSVLQLCCPSGFYLADAVPGSVGGNCLSDVSSGMVLTYGSTASGDSTSWAMATTTLTASSTVGGIGIQGWIIKYHTTTATSAPITSTTATSASMTSTTTQTSSTTAPATSQPISATSSSSGSGLTPAAKMGIGVGIGVGAIGVIALLVALFLFHKRRQRTESESVHNLYHYPQPPITSVPQAEYYQPRYPAELNAFKLRPGEGDNPPAELPSRNWASGNGVS